ncbi:glucose-6-phosphate isomerase [Montanilutibacter psychrotolerans]|uniref:Glucose-6-phosphate isomerase n=1 Tax=Montanilutibacter psychrotolerans TaxID=1327343 RepID=A0A3M8T0F4_9GAMM|nr:glucose-6-phosphate isomerase [Lysobacter psychrotolerans]RNF86435.1 glucose-6-phosphate isomerase [Lysobacter psychrotolerans]
MTNPAASHDAMRTHATRLQTTSLRSLVEGDPARATDFAFRIGPLYVNFARQGYDREALDQLFSLAEANDLAGRIRALFDGEPVNTTEHRPALHTALRSDLSDAPVAKAAHAQAIDVRARMRGWVQALAAGPVTDIVSIGIGGSDLGPRLAAGALSEPAAGRFRLHFLSNIDGNAVERMLAELDPARTAVLLVSKSFGTRETLLNGEILRDWLDDASRLYAITANVDRAREAFDIPAERVLPMWDWVGGRYSLWSAVGLPVALAIGMDGFEAMLAGAAEMDAHVLRQPLRQNVAVWHALTAVWNRNALGLSTQAVLPYDDRLKLLPNYLQQLVMESLGKSVRADGSPVTCDTVAAWWGGVGTDSQHSFFQALHQGTQVVPLDLIGIADPGHDYRANRDELHANLLAQSEALANGDSHDDPHRVYPGGRPSTWLQLDRLEPRALGALLALYEHSVYLQGVIWGINPFDQFGVELGKQLASQLLPALAGDADASDPVTRELLAQLRGRA